MVITRDMKLSIIIAAYNVDLYIKKCIETCFIEELSSQYEIIVVNDGSVDRTKEIIQNMRAISNLKIINKENQGLGAARNTGIQKASGKYIWMLDGDDFIETCQLKFLLNEIDISNLDVYGMNYNITDQHGVAFNTAYPLDKNTEIFEATIYYQKFKGNSYTWQYIFKRSIFLDNKLLFLPSINMQDSEILPKIIYYSKSVKYLNVIGYNYVQHSESLTNAKDFSKRYKYFESIIIVNQSLQKFGYEIMKTNSKLAEVIIDKRLSLHQIVFNHVVYFPYTKENLKSILKLLRENKFYPFIFSPPRKLRFVKFGLNNFPYLTKFIADQLRNLKT